MSSLPTAAELNLWDYEMPEGMALSVYPPAQEHLDDPFWWDQGGRDPLDQKFIFRLPAGEDRTERLRKIVKGYPRYGPKMYEKCARAGRADIIRELLALGAKATKSLAGDNDDGDKNDNGDGGASKGDQARAEVTEAASDDAAKPDTQSASAARDGDDEGEEEEDDEDDEDDDEEPSASMDPPIALAAFDGHLECVKVLVEEVKLDVNTKEDNGATALTNAAVNGHKDIVNYLLDKGAKITFDRRGLNDVQAAIKSGSIETLNALVSNQQWESAKYKLNEESLLYAAASGKEDMVKRILHEAHYPAPPTSEGDSGATLPKLRKEQHQIILDSLPHTVANRGVDASRLLLSYLTPHNNKGGFEYFKLDDEHNAQVFNCLEDAMEGANDIPDLFDLVWPATMRPPQATLDKDTKAAETYKDRINRRLISACSEGCPKTVATILERWGGNANHISHKYFTTPLGRAAGSNKNPLAPRLESAKVLLQRPEIDVQLANGQWSNGDTPLALAVNNAARMEKEVEMCKLLLEYGGPVDKVHSGLQQSVDSPEAGRKVAFHVASFEDEPRAPVEVMTKDEYDQLPKERKNAHIEFELDGDKARTMLAGFKIRKTDQQLAADDPKKRPTRSA